MLVNVCLYLSLCGVSVCACMHACAFVCLCVHCMCVCVCVSEHTCWTFHEITLSDYQW